MFPPRRSMALFKQPLSRDPIVIR